jgi:hypothetical protein
MNLSLTASPFLIDGEFVPDPVKAGPAAEAAWISRALPGSRLVATLDDVPLLAIKSGKKLIFFVPSIDGSSLDYYMECVTLKTRPSPDLPKLVTRKVSYQCSVYRVPDLRMRSLRFPHLVFWRFLVSHRRNVVSDNEQTDKGRGFWESRCAEAFAGGFKVFGIAAERSASGLIITAATELNRVSDTARFYSRTDRSGANYRLLIGKV